MLGLMSGKRQRMVEYPALMFTPCANIPAGLYEQQDPNQQDYNLRGKFQTDENGEYAFYCLRPSAYPIPDDGPGAKLLTLMDRHHYRPAHIHLVVSDCRS